MSDLTEQITDVLREVVRTELGLQTGDYFPSAVFDKAAERMAALFTEETRELADGMGGISTNWKTGETTSYVRPCTRLRRWVSSWSVVEQQP
jgi:hypothetical protein